MFTKEEVSLCKQIAGKHRKKLKHGDWFHDEKSKTTEIFHRNKTRVERKILTYIHPTGELPDIRCFHWFSLWTISDCLEFLRERKWTNYQFSFDKKGKTEIHIIQTPFEFRSNQEIVERGTFLEVLLKAVLAILEEGK